LDWTSIKAVERTTRAATAVCFIFFLKQDKVYFPQGLLHYYSSAATLQLPGRKTYTQKKVDENGPPSLSLSFPGTRSVIIVSLFLLFVTLAYFGLAKVSLSSLSLFKKAESRNEMDQKEFSINTVLFAPFNNISLGELYSRSCLKYTEQAENISCVCEALRPQLG